MTAGRGLLALALLLLPVAAHGHKPSDSYLALAVDGATLRGRWDIALRDLEQAIGLDADGDGRITWGELRARESAVDAYAMERLRIAQAGVPCPIRVAGHQVDRHSDGAYAVLRFNASCPSAPRAVAIDYDLLFELDPQHRGLLRLEHRGATQTAIFDVDRRLRSFDVADSAPWSAPWRGFLDYAREGVWHIWRGTDHLLFLLCLLLPAVLRREAGGWQPVSSLRPALRDVLTTVTAFTAAHSISLGLAAFGVLELPSRWVESAIAASVALAALNNLHPLFESRRWAVAFGFGLVHGLGFASVLGDLGLPAGSRLPALLGFNLGVEAGQLAVLAGFLPLAWLARGSRAYRRFGLALGSALIALLAGVWLVERSLDLAPLV